MNNCKNILMFLSGILIGLVLWIGSDLYSTYKQNVCIGSEEQELTASMK